MGIIKRGCLVLSLILVFVGCATVETVLTDVTEQELLGGEATGDFLRKLKTAEDHWSRADQPGELEAAIAAWEDAIRIETPKMDPALRRARVYAIYVRLSRAYYLLGDTVLWLSVEDPALVEGQISEVLNLGRQHAERALGLYSPEFLEGIQLGQTFGQAAEKHLDKGAVLAMFWWSALLGRWLAHQSRFTALTYIEDMRRVSHRAYELGPASFFHAPVGYLGAYYTQLPATTNGDLPLSKKYFEESIARAPEMLQHHLNFAYLYAKKAQDRALFEALLNAAIETPLSLEPELRIENIWQQRKARRLLDNVDDYFSAKK